MLFLIFDMIALTFSLILLISASISHFLCNPSLLTLANLLAAIFSLCVCSFHITICRFFRLCMFLMGFLMHNRNSIKYPCTLLFTIFVFFLLFWVLFLLMLCLKGQSWNIASFGYHSYQCLK